MTGLCGVVGAGTEHGSAVAADLAWTGEERRTDFDDGTLRVIGSFTDERDADQPVAVGDDSLLWVWGSVFGVESPDGYRPRESVDESTAAYCAGLYETYGPAFVSRLNGDFVGVRYDRRDGCVSVFTDRLGLRDTYYARPNRETVVFSTNVQSLSRHPDVTPAFDPDYVAEYLSCGFKTFGVRTPLANTWMFPPGTITSIDAGTVTPEHRRYWTPRYRPLDRPFSYFLEEFTSRFRDAVGERLAAERQYGLLLSGGVDSRLVLAAANTRARDRITAYHMAGWMSREARAAERVATTAGVDFEWLRRDSGYHERAVHHNPALSNFVGSFQQAHAEGFMSYIREDVDEMVTGSFADATFKGYSFPQRTLQLGPIGTVLLPTLAPMDGIDRYVDYWTGEPPRYLQTTVDAREVLEREIHTADGGVEHHGITYGSPEELFACATLTPRTNGIGLSLVQSLRQHVPAWSPYVDNRLVDLYLSTPAEYFVRYNLLNRAVKRLDPELAGVRYATTGLPVGYPLPAHFVAGLVRRAREKYGLEAEPPAPHLTNGPWPDKNAIVREQSFAREIIEENEDAIRALPFLDWDGVRECYQAHQNGADLADELYGLLTLLEMPVTDRVVDASG